MTTSVASIDFSDFPLAFPGSVSRPADDGFDELRAIWNTRGHEQVPALIVRPIDAEGVRIAVRYAAEKSISIAVRGGGHGIDGFAMPHDALVVDLSLMKEIEIDPISGVTKVGAGVLFGELNAHTQQHGFAVPAGTVSGVGVSGFTLGGGVGHLTRRFGATVDTVLAIDVVTMDGRILSASAEENQELFWGLRGAGQNLAIATSFTFQAHLIGPAVISGFLLYGPADGVAVLAGLNDAMARSPRELAVSPIVRPAPPIPGVPAELVGAPVILAAVVYTGEPEGFDDAMTQVRMLPQPLLDMVGPSTWIATTSFIDEWMGGSRRWHNGGGYLADVTPEIAQIIMDRVAVAPQDCEVHLPLVDGAMHDFPEDSAAFSRAGVTWMYEITGQWDSPDDDDEYIGWVDETAALLAPFTLANGYINLNRYRGVDSVRKLYGSDEKWNRLVELKTEWDPHNRLSYNKNIPPRQAD